MSGFALKDLGDVAYNPAALAEDNPAFDSTYDDMLVARIVTDASNVATITNLANKDALAFAAPVVGTNIQLSGVNGATCLYSRPSTGQEFRGLTACLSC